MCNPLFNKQQSSTSTAENKNKKLNECNNKNNRTALSKKKTLELPNYTGITAKEVINNVQFFTYKTLKCLLIIILGTYSDSIKV